MQLKIYYSFKLAFIQYQKYLKNIYLDWEATNEAIEEQVARESYLQWLRDNERRNCGAVSIQEKRSVGNKPIGSR